MRFDDRECIASDFLIFSFDHKHHKYNTYVIMYVCRLSHRSHWIKIHVTLDRSFPSFIVLSQAGSDQVNNGDSKQRDGQRSAYIECSFVR